MTVHFSCISSVRRMWATALIILLTRAMVSGLKGMAPLAGPGVWSAADGQTWDNVKVDWSAWNKFPPGTGGAREFSAPQHTPGLPNFGGKWRLCPAEEAFQFPGTGNHNLGNPYVGGRNIYQKYPYTKQQKRGLRSPIIQRFPNKKLMIVKSAQN